MQLYKKVRLSELITQVVCPEKIDDVRNERYITLSSYGKGAHERVIKDDKYPVPFIGYRVSRGQFIYSRIDARNGAYDIIGPELDGFVVSKDFPIYNIDKDKVLPHYLLLAVLSRSFIQQIKNSSFGATNRMRIKEEVFESYYIPLPPIEVQAQIINCIGKVKALITWHQNVLRMFDDLVKARFVEMFEDGESPIKTVEELCSDIVDCPHTTPKYEGELKNPAIRTSEIKKGFITWDTMKYVSDEEYEERISRLRPEAGDIVYGREGTFGNAAVLPEGYKFCLGQRVMLLRPDYKKCTSEYLLHAVISDDVYRQAIGKNNASTVAHVNVKDVKQFRIPLPSFDKQNQFAAFVKQVDKSKFAVQKSLEETQLLFNSLMQQYFA